MKRIALKMVFIFYLFSFIQVAGQNIDVQINDLLKKMTLEEKVGQMTQITLEVISKPRQDGSFVNEIDPEKLKKSAKKRKAEFLHLQIQTEKQPGDIAGTKLKKFS